MVCRIVHTGRFIEPIECYLCHPGYIFAIKQPIPNVHVEFFYNGFSERFSIAQSGFTVFAAPEQAQKELIA